MKTVEMDFLAFEVHKSDEAQTFSLLRIMRESLCVYQKYKKIYVSAQSWRMHVFLDLFMRSFPSINNQSYNP